MLNLLTAAGLIVTQVCEPSSPLVSSATVAAWVLAVSSVTGGVDALVGRREGIVGRQAGLAIAAGESDGAGVAGEDADVGVRAVVGRLSVFR